MKITVKEAAEVMGVTPDFVRESIAQGKIKGAYCINRKYKRIYYIDKEAFYQSFGKGE